jgi:hypothetical protein
VVMACLSLLATLEASRMPAGAGDALRTRRPPAEKTQRQSA